MKIHKNGRYFHQTKLLGALLASNLILSACSEASNTSNAANVPQVVATPVKTTTKTAENIDPLAHGKRIYKRCKTCHTLEQDGKHRVGPNLWAIMGSQAGTKEGFAYSKALKESEIIWTEETMNAFIEKPSKYIPKNRMSFVGLKKEEDRRAVIDYMISKTQAESE